MDPADPRALELIQELDEYQSRMYPAESNYLDSLDELKKPHVRFIGAFDGEKLTGIGAVKSLEGYGEIKRMFVRSEHRGEGVAEQILAALEKHLVSQGIPVARLETGIRHDAAIRFYERNGYRRRGPYGSYGNDPLSLFYEKQL